MTATTRILRLLQLVALVLPLQHHSPQKKRDSTIWRHEGETPAKRVILLSFEVNTRKDQKLGSSDNNSATVWPNLRAAMSLPRHLAGPVDWA